MNELLSFRLFWTQPFRRWIVKLCRAVPDDSRFHVWLLDQLYPDDAIVQFGAAPTGDDE